MLTRIRIEVEERTPEQAVLCLDKYEHAVKREEARRWFAPSEDPNWLDSPEARSHYDEHLGRELVEEVIEFDQSLPGYNARRVIRFTRLDTRDPETYSMEHGWVPTPNVMEAAVG